MARGGPEVAVAAIFRTHGCPCRRPWKRRSTAILRARYSWTSTRNGLSADLTASFITDGPTSVSGP